MLTILGDFDACISDLKLSRSKQVRFGGGVRSPPRAKGRTVRAGVSATIALPRLPALLRPLRFCPHTFASPSLTSDPITRATVPGPNGYRSPRNHESYASKLPAPQAYALSPPHFFQTIFSAWCLVLELEGVTRLLSRGCSRACGMGRSVPDTQWGALRRFARPAFWMRQRCCEIP